MPIISCVFSTCKPTLDSVGRQEAHDGTKEVSRPAGAECALNSREQGLSSQEERCARLEWRSSEQFLLERRSYLLCCVIGTRPTAASPVALPRELWLPRGMLSSSSQGTEKSKYFAEC